MPQLEFFLIAESLSVDQGTNRLSLFNILEEIRGIELPPGVGYPPGTIPQLVAASSWNMAPEDQGQKFLVELRLHLPSDEQVVELGKLEFVAERRRQRVLQLVIGCPVVGPGEMQFEVLLNGDHRASHAMTVIHEARPRVHQEATEETDSQPAPARE